MVAPKDICLLFLGLLASGSLALPDGKDGIPYTVSDTITWQGVLDETTGILVNISGSSMEEIEAKAKALYPNNTIFNDDLSDEDKAMSPTDSSLEKRTTVMQEPWCDGPRAPAWSGTIREGWWYLSHLNGNAGLQPGPRVCSRVSCSYNSAIYACNDTPGKLFVPWLDVVVAVSTIMDKCTVIHPNSLYTRGQIFSEDGRWNIIIGADRC